MSLDAKKYKLVQQLDAAMTSGTPSLIGCDRLTVSGDVHMAGDTVFKVRFNKVAQGPTRRKIGSDARLTPMQV